MAPNVTLSFGPMLIGTMINMILYGVLIVQTYHYYLSYKNDARWIKWLVYYLFVIETLNTACDIQMMYQPLIQHFGEAEATKYFPMMFAAEPIVIVFVSTPIQFFFAWRVWLLTKSKLLALAICFFAVVSLGGGIWTTALIVKVKLFARKAELHWSALVWFLAACISDVLITTVLVITLSRRKTGFAATDDAIQRIIRMTVQTGALTAFFAIGDVVFFMTMGHTALNFLWDLALSKLYANCLLSTLNARNSFKECVSHPSAGPRGTPGGGSSGNRRAIADNHTISPSQFESQHVSSEDEEFELEGSLSAGSKSRERSFVEKAVAESLHHLHHPHHQSTKSHDLEYGITVTKSTVIDLASFKVVETVQDPRPPYPLTRNQHQLTHSMSLDEMPVIVGHAQ